MNRNPLSRLDDRWGNISEEKKVSLKEQIVLRLLLLIEDWVYSLMVRKPTPPRETTLRLLIVVLGLLLVVLAMVIGGAAEQVDDVFRNLPFLPGILR